MTKKEVLALSNSELDKVVKIQGTKFDRKRKVSDRTISEIQRLFRCGKSMYSISKEMGVSVTTVQYYTDPVFRFLRNHTGGSHAHGVMDASNRAEYKRSLVRSNAKVVYPMD